MATDTRTIVFQQTTDAEFRTWVAAIKAQLIAIGLTQTADTGQVDTATVAKPAAANASQGYVVFRFNDAAHATAPVFFKLEFGSGSAAATPAMWLTIGSSSDGSGNIGGTAYKSRTQVSFTGATASVNNYANYNSTIGMFWASWAAQYLTSQYATLIIARPCDWDETPRTDGLAMVWTASTAVAQYYDVGLGTTKSIDFYQFTNSTTGASDPPVYHGGYPIAWAVGIATTSGVHCLPGVYGIHSYHWPPFLNVSITPYVTERNFISMPHNGTAYAYDADGTIYGKCMFIWE